MELLTEESAGGGRGVNADLDGEWQTRWKAEAEKKQMQI